MLSKNKSDQPAKFYIQNYAKVLELFTFFFKKRPKDELAKKYLPTLNGA